MVILSLFLLARIIKVFMTLVCNSYFKCGNKQSFFDKHYLPLLPAYFVASQVYALKMSFFSYIESRISSLNFRHTEFNEFIEIVTFNVVNRLRHYRDDGIEDDIPLWLKKRH